MNWARSCFTATHSLERRQENKTNRWREPTNNTKHCACGPARHWRLKTNPKVTRRTNRSSLPPPSSSSRSFSAQRWRRRRWSRGTGAPAKGERPVSMAARSGRVRDSYNGRPVVSAAASWDRRPSRLATVGDWPRATTDLEFIHHGRRDAPARLCVCVPSAFPVNSADDKRLANERIKNPIPISRAKHRTSLTSTVMPSPSSS